MASSRPITIVGGGLAGLTLGIGLRQREIPVTVWEAGQYPRHRVCGEFISGSGTSVLQRLWMLPLLERAGAIYVNTATFISGRNSSPVRYLPMPAMGLSRYLLDAALAQEFRKLGGQLQHARWNPPHNEAEQTAQNAPGEGLIRATGRRPQPTENGWRWFGLKAHATNVTLTADLEMHVSADNYVGVNRINGGEVKVCGLFRGRPGEVLASGFDLLRGKPGSALHERLASARFDEKSFCSVAGLSLRPQRAFGKAECCIGDALTMIPPVTGNGMSMAFESAELAIEPLTQYSRGTFNWTDARDAIAHACDQAFAQRLMWARRLQSLMFSPVLRTPLGKPVLGSDSLWKWMFARTR